MSRSYVIAAIYSVIIHSLIILSFFNYIKTEQPKPVGYQNVVHVYVITEPVIIAKHQSSVHHTSEHIQGAINRVGRDDRAPTAGKNNDYGQKRTGKTNQLLIILHNQIQQYINENYDLVPFIKSRTALIQFLLTRQGEIRDVHISQSSGMKIFDNLALQAVGSIQAANLAKKYLARDTYFKINVDYLK